MMLKGTTKELEAILKVLFLAINKNELDLDDEQKDGAVLLIRLGRTQCEELREIASELGEIAADWIRREQEVVDAGESVLRRDREKLH